MPNLDSDQRDNLDSKNGPEGLFFPLLFSLITLFCHVTAGGIGLGIGASVQGADLSNAESLIGDGNVFTLAAIFGSLGFLV